jgi:hypothetical protein
MTVAGAGLSLAEGKGLFIQKTNKLALPFAGELVGHYLCTLNGRRHPCRAAGLTLPWSRRHRIRAVRLQGGGRSEYDLQIQVVFRCVRGEAGLS